jgi:hypothetical protein
MRMKKTLKLIMNLHQNSSVGSPSLTILLLGGGLIFASRVCGCGCACVVRNSEVIIPLRLLPEVLLPMAGARWKSENVSLLRVPCFVGIDH